jgi:predicted ATPase
MASSLLRKIPYMPLGYNVPTLTSPVAEFISDTLLSEDINYRISSYRSNMLRKVVTRFEKTALKGEVELKKRKKEQIPEIMYKFRGKQLSLLQSSSSVGELAPILISLKYRNFGKGHVLVIEEPEAHLHPAMVEKMADFLGSIRNAGVSLIIPTHSDYLLSSINTRMKEYSIATKLGERISKTSPLINPEQTVAYSFDGENGDTVTKRLRITKEGIPLDEFNEIADKLQEKHASLTAVSLEKA